MNTNSNVNFNRNDSEQAIKLFHSITTEYNKIKILTKNVLPNQTEVKTNLTSLIETIQQLFYIFYKNKKYETNRQETKVNYENDAFLLKNSEILIDIIVYIGFVLNKSNEDGNFKVFLKYSNLISNLAEKIPISLNNSTLNKLVNYLIEAAFNLLKDFTLNKKKLLEVFRSLGSLVYQNGSNLNIFNLNQLYGINEIYSKTGYNIKYDGLLYSFHNLIESEQTTDQSDLDLNLILTQLICNLTMSNLNEPVCYIDDKYKVKSVSLSIKLLRGHNFLQANNSLNYSFTSDTSRHFNAKTYADDFKIIVCKILTKSLQTLENLFVTIQNLTDQQADNWLQSHFVGFHLGDILAIAKNLSFYGIFKDPASKQNQTSEEKLQPSNVNILLDKNKKPDDDLNSRMSGGDDDEEKKSSVISKKNKNNNKRSTKTNSSKTSSSSNQVQKGSIDFNLNSLQCLRETQVPLIQYKNNLNENQISDSDFSADSNSSSSFFIEKCNAKVRISAIGVLLTAFQSLDKKTVISYWDSFLGQNSSSKSYNLIWSVRNDPSPKVRLIAATCLSYYLECVRNFFTLAASENTVHQNSSSFSNNQTLTSSSFVPMSYSIANLIRQLHSDLNYSLNNFETFSLNQIQLLKCMQCLIKATPYQKLKPGLVYKLISNLHLQLTLKSKKNNENSSIVINEILNCLLLILTNHHQLAEVHLALISNSNKNQQDAASKASTNTTKDELDNLSEKLEQISTVFKAPVITQSRVTYFYTNESKNLNNSHSFNESLTASGQMTPLFNDLIGQDDTNKSWLVNYCLKYYTLINSNDHKLVCLDLLQIICKKYFDLLRRDLFFDDITQLILNNIDLMNDTEQIQMKTLKLLEELARCLATSELRTMTNIDLNDCCKFWSSLLNSKLIPHILCNEQQYVLSSCACDCLAGIGASIFELLPFQKRIYCLTNLLHLTKSNSSLIRSSSVRALGVYVTFTSLKEDQNFLNDLSQCLYTLLNNDTNNLVRQKAAWSLSNLSEVLVENQDKLGKAFMDDFNLTIWFRLLEISSNTCAKESDKLKTYLVRTIGNLIRYITRFDSETIGKELKDLKRVEKVITKSIEALCSCRNVKMLKVKWNLSHSIGVAIHSFSTWQLQASNTNWLIMFYDTLLDLFTQSTNFKVRINACIALMSVNLADKTSCIYMNHHLNGINESIYIRLWISLLDAFYKINNENITQIDATNELQHKTTLLHQLCKLFTYLCKNLRIDDLNAIMLKCLNKVKLNSFDLKTNETNGLNTIQIRSFLVDYIQTIFLQIDQNKQEVQYYNEALTNLNLLNSNKQNSLDEDCIILLNSLLQKTINRNANAESESSENENENNNSDYRKKYPFSQVYD